MTTPPAIPRQYPPEAHPRIAAGSPRRSQEWRPAAPRPRALPLRPRPRSSLAVILHPRGGRDQAAHDDILLQAAQVVHLAVDRGFGKHAGSLLERRRGDERIG